MKTWSDHQVALRWLQIFPGKRTKEQLGDRVDIEVEILAKDSERIRVIRSRLSDFSWFMRALSEPIARRANAPEKCTGAFWEGHYKMQRILDETALLAVCMYVDLNPIRAAMAETIEESIKRCGVIWHGVSIGALAAVGEQVRLTGCASMRSHMAEAISLVKRCPSSSMRKPLTESPHAEGCAGCCSGRSHEALCTGDRLRLGDSLCI